MEHIFESFFSTDSTDTIPETDSTMDVSDGGLEHHNPIVQFEPTIVDITQSVQTSSDFVNLPNPADVVSASATGIYTNLPHTPNDDVVMVNTNQMHRMGITDQQSFDLVMTHEAMHRVLQNADAGFTSYEEELCCDYIAGVRAGLNNMDVTSMKESLAHTEASATHPAGMNRVDSIETGIAFAKDYLATHNGEPPSMSECIRDFRHSVLHENSELVSLRPEDNISFKGYDSVISTVGNNKDVLNRIDDNISQIERQIELNDLELHVNTSSDEAYLNSKLERIDRTIERVEAGLNDSGESDISEQSNVSFKGHSESEALRHFRHAKDEYEQARADYHRHMDMNGHQGHDYEDVFGARDALRRMDDALRDMDKWDHIHHHMHPGMDVDHSHYNPDSDSHDRSNVNFKGYTKSEIDQKLSHAEAEKRRYEGLVEHHKYMAKHGLDKADTEYHLNKVKEFQNRANECAAEANKWRYTKPDKK